MLEAGADIKFVQEQLGHVSVQITSDVYAHISKKLEKRNIDRYEEYTSPILDQKIKNRGTFGGRNLNRSAIPSKRPPVHFFKTPQLQGFSD